MKESIQEIIRSLGSQNSGAKDSTIGFLARALHVSLPEDYVEYLRTSNGAAGAPRAGEWIVLWSADDVVKLNKAYRVKEDFAPGTILFGTMGGETAYAFDTNVQPFRIVSVSLVSRGLAPSHILAPSFGKFLEGLAGYNGE